VSTVWATGLLVVAVLVGLALMVAHSLVAQEIRAWLPHVARRLVRRAARLLPADFQARYEAEWLAELAAWEDRAISALARAAHIRWKTKAIRESLGEAGVRGERAKRILDVSVAVGMLVVLSPNLILVALAIKLDSPGPVFFRLPRAGRAGRSFSLIKFRSMYVDAPARLQELVDSSKDSEQLEDVLSEDPRVTRVGAFIRRTSLDEVPQLVNVIKGDMSLVGPPATHPAEREEVPSQEDNPTRTDLRPGLTGPWQIDNFAQGPHSVRRRSKMEEEYGRQRSLLTDLRIMARTVAAVLFGRRR
jgi:lipopolysaccharide/colanic/teichoic acid biosynthesis glycosyltransferase